MDRKSFAKLTVDTVCMPSEFWYMWNSTCYMFSSASLEHSSVISACAERNSTALMVETLEEHEMLLSFTQNVSYWTGGDGDPKTKDFKWFNNETILNSLWMTKKPDKQGRCVRYRPKGLANSDCKKERQYICERSYHLCLEEQHCCVNQTSTTSVDTTNGEPQMVTQQKQLSFSMVTTEQISRTSEHTPFTQLSITQKQISTEKFLTSSQRTSTTNSKLSSNAGESTVSQLDPITDLSQIEFSTNAVTQHNATANASQATQNQSMADCELCYCQCFRNDTPTEEELLKEYQEIIKSLTRPKHKTSLAVRKLNCAKDPRVSAAAMGYIGLMVIFIPVALIVICDIQRCFMKTQLPRSRRSSVCDSVKTKLSSKFVPDISLV